jgi:hypothetical protein
MRRNVCGAGNAVDEDGDSCRDEGKEKGAKQICGEGVRKES